MKMTNLTKLALSIVAIAALNGCDDDSSIEPVPSDVTIVNGDVYINEGTIYGDNTNPTDPTDPTDPGLDDDFEPIPNPVVRDVSGLPYGDFNLTGTYTDVDMTLDADHVWLLDGEVNFKGSSTLTIEPGTVIAALPGDAFLVIEKDSVINAQGTADLPITFTTKEVLEGDAAPGVGQWGGLTIIGNAGIPDNTSDYEVNPDKYKVGYEQYTESSGILTHIQILNSGATSEFDQAEINGLSLVGVGSGTTINNIRVDLSDDDGIEIWGGTVNLSDIFITRCTDDYFDIDEGYSGTVTNLKIDTLEGNAAVEMSGNSHPTFVDFDIRVGQYQVEEGGFYFKKAGISAVLDGGRLIHYGEVHGAIHSHDSVSSDVDNTSFTNVTIFAPADLSFTGVDATDLKDAFDSDTSNELINP